MQTSAETTALIWPDKPGRWTVEYDLHPVRVYEAEVRADAPAGGRLCGLVANLPEIDGRWHTVEWININGWVNWRPKEEGNGNGS